MIGESAELARSLVDSYGIAVLFVAFVLEGALVGKVIPTRALVVGVVLAAGAGPLEYAAVFGAAVVGATVGQATLFLLVRRCDVDPVAHSRIPVEDGHLNRADRWFDRWGPATIAASNAVPLVRGSMTVPTALTQTRGSTFAVYSFAGSTIYAGLLVGIAGGLDSALTTDLVLFVVG